jgi:hypothetical protein
MPKDKTSDDAAPETAAVAEEIPKTKSAPAMSVAAPTKKKYRNISPMLLTLDDGSHFARNTVAELTPTEVERFQQAERNTRDRHIAPVGGV